MNQTAVNQWLVSYDITLKQGFVPTLKDYARTYKKRPASVCLRYMRC